MCWSFVNWSFEGHNLSTLSHGDPRISKSQRFPCLSCLLSFFICATATHDSTIPRLDPMYNRSITFLVDKFPNPISHLVSICVISRPFIPTNHNNPFSISICSYNRENIPCQPEDAGRARCVHEPWTKQQGLGVKIQEFGVNRT